MRTIPVYCSLLMALGVSTMMLGCAPAAKSTSDKNPTSSVKSAPKGVKPGSDLGRGGAEVPDAPGSGSSEVPKKP